MTGYEKVLTRIQDQQFDSEAINVDGNAFDGCTINNCTLIYRGGKVMGLLPDTWFQGTNKWEFEDAALRTVRMLHMMYKAGGFHRDFAMHVIERIKADD